MTLSRKQIITLIFTLTVIFSVPIAIFLTQKRQDVRPKALQGKANFLLSPDSTTVNAGSSFNVLVSMRLTDPSIRISGADFVLLYDKNLLDVANVVPQVTGVDQNAAFTDAPIVNWGKSFDSQFNFLRVAEVAVRATDKLAGDTVNLANVTFLAKATGNATIKFPDDNKYLQVVGTGTASPSGTLSSADVSLSLEPSSANISLNSTNTFSLKAVFPHGSAGQKLDYFKTVVNFSKDYPQMPPGEYIDTSSSGLGKIFRVDGPQAVNDTGKMVIELGANVPGAGPATDQPITIAKITLAGKALTPSPQTLSFGTSQIVDNSSAAFSVNSQAASYTVSGN